jgi:PhnB protein
MAFRPYLAFAGNCREAFTRYQEIFGGELTLLTAEDAPPGGADIPPASKPDAVMHAALVTGDDLLMGADDFSGQYGGSVSGMCLNVGLEDPAEVERVFGALSDGGTVQMPVTETFFNPAFGMCTDRFGTPWMVMVEQPDPATG